MMMSLYVPRDAIRRGDCILIVDDIIDSGETQRAMIRIAQKAKAEVTGIYALIAVGHDWKQRLGEFSTVQDRKSTRLNSSHVRISYAVFCLRSEEHTSELQSRP